MFYTCTRLRAIAHGLVLLVLAPAVVTAQSSTPNTVEGFLNASEWFVEYEVSFVVNYQWDTAHEVGTVSTSITMNRNLKGTKTLNLRSGGPALLMLEMASDPAFQSLSATEQQTKLTSLIMRIDDIANWIYGGFEVDENASFEEQQAASMEQMQVGFASLDYLYVERGDRVYDPEYNGLFDYIDSSKYTGSGKVIPAEDMKFEIDGSKRRYLLTLTTGLQDMSQSSVKKWNHRYTKYDGSEPESQTVRGEMNLGSLPQTITIDDSTSLFGATPMMDSVFDPSNGKIIGEKTVDAHYSENSRDIPGKLTFKYTVTPKG